MFGLPVELFGRKYWTQNTQYIIYPVVNPIIDLYSFYPTQGETILHFKNQLLTLMYLLLPLLTSTFHFSVFSSILSVGLRTRGVAALSRSHLLASKVGKKLKNANNWIDI